MSANNWMKCPACRKRAEDERREQLRRADKSYGKVSSEEYEAAMAEARKPVELEDTFREDYELGMCENGKFFVSYYGRCQICNYGIDYKFEKVVPFPKAGAKADI